MSDSILIAKIHSPFGVRGLARLLNFATPPAPIPEVLYSETGKSFRIEFLFQKDQFSICKIEGITSREEMAELKGIKLYTQAAHQLNTTDEFYYSQLMGCSVLLDNDIIGTVEDIQNFGAGDLLLINTGRSSFYCPFHADFITDVKIESKVLHAHTNILDLKDMEK